MGRRRHTVNVCCGALGAVDATCYSADEHIVDAVTIENREDAIRVELGTRGNGIHSVA